MYFLAYGLHVGPNILGDNNMSTVWYSCRPVDDYWDHFLFRKWSIVDAVIADFFPFLVILTGNILIITRILKSHYERKAQMGATSTKKLMTSTTAKLIGLSACMYLILKSPYDVIQFLYFDAEWDSFSGEEAASYRLAARIGILAFNFNSAFEFIVYFVGGRKFREAFLETFLQCRKANNQNAQRTDKRRNINAGTTSPV